MENKRETAPLHGVRVVQRETVERYVTALYEPGVYDPDYAEAICLACGFGFDWASGGRLGDLRVYLPGEARFCPICGSRFERKANIAGLYPEEDGKAEHDGIQGMELVVDKDAEAQLRALIGDALYEQMMEEIDQENQKVNVWEF